MTTQTRIPKALHAALLSMLLAVGVGGGAYIGEAETSGLTPYLQAAAEDESTSDAVKLALVLGSFFESSFRHIGKPYTDSLGKGQPLTVCNGLTGAWVDPRKTYSPVECYALEVVYYKRAEQDAKRLVTTWDELDALQQASILDFIHNKGVGQFSRSTMRRLFNQGLFEQACRQNERWVYGTVRGVSVVLSGLTVRANTNSDLCAAGVTHVLPAL